MKQTKLTTKLLLFITLLLPLSFASCGDDDIDTSKELKIVFNPAGKIPGLGNTEGDLTGWEFKLPDGIVLDREIKGTYDRLGSEEAISSETGYAIADANIILGSTSKNRVSLFIPLKNETGQNIKVTFPGGLIIESASGFYQNGILLKEAVATIPANKTYNIVMLLYCGNMSREISSYNETYNFTVRSNSAPVDDICKRFANKKINHEQSPESMQSAHAEMCDKIQDIVWQITDSGIGVTTDNANWINALP